MTAAASISFTPGADRAWCPTCSLDHGDWIGVNGDVFQCHKCGRRQNADAMESKRDKDLREASAKKRNVQRFNKGVARPPSSNGNLAIVESNIRRELAAVRDHGKQMVVHILAAGKWLNRARELVEHGQWGKWLDTNFALSEETATNFRHVADFAAKNPTIDLTPIAPTILYQIARPSVPLPAVQEFIALLESGAPITPSGVSSIVKHSQADEKLIKDSAPATIRAAVEGGELSVRKAASITSAYLKAPLPVQQVIEKHGLSDPNIIPALVAMQQRGSETFEEIALTGALQSSKESVPLEDATIRDLQALLDEKSQFHRSEGAPNYAVDAQVRVVSAEAGRLVLDASMEDLAQIKTLLTVHSGGVFARLTVKGDS